MLICDSKGRLMNMSASSQTPVQTLTPGTLLNRKQIANFIGVSERTISNMVRERRIPVIKFGRSVRFDPIRVRKALDKYEIQEL
tara:strand:+ start:170 stop:421 length:252 start_codon:yes stop_codon:yes gene_type:complete